MPGLRVMDGPRITGEGWAVYFDPEISDWTMQGDERPVLQMIRERLPSTVIENEYMSISKAEDNRPFGSLHDDVVAFPKERGISANTNGVPRRHCEKPPT